jgi:hypothetical protein
MPPKITRCVATPTLVFVHFSESLDSPNANNAGNYKIFIPPVNDDATTILSTNNFEEVTYAREQFLTTIKLTRPLSRGQVIVVQAKVESDGDLVPGNSVASATVNGADDSGEAVVDEAVEDLAAYPVLTEEVGYPPSPIASGGGTQATAPAQASLGGVVETTLRQLLGWKPKADDPKGFVGALNASFECKLVEGHAECTWTPRTYAVQTDLSGGITGAQASLYSRTKGAVDQALPLLEGLNSLDEEAKPEDIQALRAVARTQLTELVGELGIPGGPRVQRITQLFNLLLGQQLPTDPQAAGFTLITDPDNLPSIGTLGNMRDEMGLTFSFVNTVEDEQTVSNFRIVSDYITSLAQSWLNNLQFFVLTPPKGVQPFFGTLLVLLSRQLSVVAEKVNEVRFTLDSVFIGPSERQTLILDS